jgi:NitT/TauT family transport system permease protein
MNNQVTLKPPVGISVPSAAEIEAAAAHSAKRRRQTVYFWRYFILIVFLGGWEVLVRTKLIDEFFFSKP